MNDRAGIYERLTALPYIHAYRQLIMGAVELDVFTQLETPVTAGELYFDDTAMQDVVIRKIDAQ